MSESPVLTPETTASEGAFEVLTDAADIKEIDDRAIEPVEVPEWKRVICIRSLSGAERDEFELAMLDQKRDKRGRVQSQEVNLRNLRAKLIVRTAVTGTDPETARPLFKPEDATWLGTKNGQALQRLYTVAQRLSGLSSEEVEELTEELGKGPSEDSGIDSPSPSVALLSETSNVASTPVSSPNGSHTTELSPSETAV